MRSPLLMLGLMNACLLLACDDWYSQDDDASDASTEPSTPVPTPDAGTACIALPVLISGGSAQVDGAFCFGVAAGASDLLNCTTTNQASDVLCVDEATGNGYVARWSGSSAVVLDASSGVAGGTIRVRNAGSYDVQVGSVRAGVCTLRRDGVSRAEFCAYAR